MLVSGFQIELHIKLVMCFLKQTLSTDRKQMKVIPHFPVGVLIIFLSLCFNKYSKLYFNTQFKRPILLLKYINLPDHLNSYLKLKNDAKSKIFIS